MSVRRPRKTTQFQRLLIRLRQSPSSANNQALRLLQRLALVHRYRQRHLLPKLPEMRERAARRYAEDREALGLSTSGK